MKEIIITVAEDGTDTVDLNGFHGKGCGALLEAIAEGDKAVTLQRKREYNEAVQQQQESAKS